MPRTEDVRASLVAEIERKEREVYELRGCLAELDEAMEAAEQARARAAAQKAASAAEEAQRVAQEARAEADRLLAALDRPAKRTTEPEPEAKKAAPPPPQPVPPPVVHEDEIDHDEEPHEHHHHMPSLHTRPGKYAHMKTWMAVQNLLIEKRAVLPIEDIVRELRAGGASLGDNPMRTVSTAVGYMNDKIFHVSKTGGKTLIGLLSIRG